MDDVQTLKLQIEKINARIDRVAESRSDCMVVFLGKTIAVGTYPTSASSWYNVQMQSMSGNETEGTAATIASAAVGNAKAYNVGTNIPPAGTNVICRQEINTNRFVFRY